jgi:hypothetical protein
MTELFDYSMDDDGKLEMIEFYNGMAIDPKTKRSKTVILGYSDAFIYTYFISDKKKKWITEKPNTLGFIPVIMLDSDIKDTPATKDLAETNIAIFNQLSEQRDLERTSAFCLLEIPNDNPPDADVELDASNLLWVPTNSSRGSAYISPDSNVLKVLRESAITTVELLQKQADQLGATSIQASSQSGEAYKLEFLGKSFVLKEGAKFAQSVEDKIVEMFGLFMSEDFEYEITYSTEFIPGVTEVTAKIAVIKASKEIGIEYTPEELQLLKDYILKVI